ncbi:uncharacterized protein LOC129949069 [Eupeodes corollae]|uniref:uncharacterized protein LOC129949069 n=1 Tax=Eupeodes corollae TaxID=290404 RepID=UPI002492CC5F|nr:uncharacterized protein LOC129949069 [Eupeodes corollae]
MVQLTPVQEYYKGKTVFITGASGFMGKVLLEKLLYSCSELKEVIIMMRPKRGKVPESRLDEMFKIPIFQRIKEEKPEVLKKVTLVQGDVTFDTLGLNGDNLKHITSNTNIVFHMAATLKLEGNLKDAIDMNTTGTKRVLDIAKNMSNLEAFIHVSTAFCNCDQEVMYEKVYDFPHKPEDLIRLAEWMDVKMLDNITPELLKPHPNTYTYSKRLAEILVRDHYPTMPVIIARPSIVSPSAYEPVPGWVDNLNGPTGLMVGAGKGVIRSMLIDGRFKSEVIPVDYAINGLITIAYEFGSAEMKPPSVPVYNITCADHRKICWGEVIELSKKIGYQYPVEAGLWYPDGCVTTNKYLHNINVLLFHWLPAYLIDFLMLLLGQKRFMIRIQNRISIGLDVLQFFTLREWNFRSQHYGNIWPKLQPEDQLIFNQNMDAVEDAEEYMISCVKGGRQYLLKESLDTLPRARKQLKMMYILDRACKVLITGFILYYLAQILVSPSVNEPVHGWVDNLNGPTGLMVGAGKGVIRSILVEKSNLSEVIPVDYAINGLVVIPYEFNKEKKPATIPVYNMTNADHRKVPWGHVIETSKKIGYQYPLNAGLWYPDPVITANKLHHKINTIFFHWLPAILIDFLLLIFLQKRLFNMDMNSEVSEEEYMIRCALGGRQFLLKEKPEDLPRARLHLKIQYVVDRVCKTLIVGGLIYWLLLTPAHMEPLPGWVDNLNGPVGVMIGAGKGVIRSMICNGELKSEIIPVDLAVNGLIVLPYNYMHMQLAKKPDRVPVFNITCSENKKKTWKWIMDVGKQFAFDYPFEIGLWYPDGNMTTNKLYHWFCVVFFMWLPAYCIDFLLFIFRQRRFMVRVQTKIATGLELLQFFTTRSWDFKSDNFMRIFSDLTPKDKEIFKMNTDDLDELEYMKYSFLGGRQYVMKEPLSSLPRSRTQLKFLFALDRVCKAIIIGTLLYWIYLKLGLNTVITSTMDAVAMQNIKT